jgi:hypothetical protein
MSANQSLTFYAKRDNTLDITIRTNAGNPVDLTGYKLQLTIKALLSDVDTAALYQGPPSFVNLQFGRFSFLVPIATTNDTSWVAVTAGFYDVSTVTPSGKTSTLLGGNVTIVQPVAQTMAKAG